jgi:hypothetical protein
VATPQITLEKRSLLWLSWIKEVCWDYARSMALLRLSQIMKFAALKLDKRSLL